MSTLYLVDEYEFFNRKPSKAQINACIKNAMAQGSKAVAIIWGENQIDLDYQENHKKWYGSGWIKTIGGSDLADELNAKQKTATTQFMAEHFKLLNIGA
jgi:hypothetical protein